MFAALAGAALPTTAAASSITISYSATDGCGDSTTGATSATLSDATSTDPLHEPANDNHIVCSTPNGVTHFFGEADLTSIHLFLSTDRTTIGGVGALIRIQDTVTITGGTGAGVLRVGWLFNGSLEAADAFYSQLYLSNLGGAEFADFRACGPSVAFATSICVADLYPTSGGPVVAGTSTSIADQLRSIDIGFTYGVPFAVDWRLQAAMGPGCSVGNSCPPPGSPMDGSGSVAFQHTLTLPEFHLFDSTGAEVFGAVALSDSGFSYDTADLPSDIATPEPASMVLVGSGLAALVARRISRRGPRR